jgi:signal transduction histidine kinase
VKCARASAVTSNDPSHEPAAASGLASIFDVARFMPHGHCYQWDPGILWTSVISDGLIAAAYIAIPFTLVFQIMRKRKDLPFDWMFACFGLFIVACGFTHVMEIITVWEPHYPAMAIVKAITAAASVPTAIILFRIAPKIVKLPTLQQLMEEQTLRLRAEAASEAKDRLIATLSHELRTPLTPVKAGIDVLEQELRQTTTYAAGGAAEQAVAMIRQNVEKERVLINDLLDLSFSGRGNLHLQFTAVDLRTPIQEAIAGVDAEMRRKKIELTHDLAASRAIVRGAPARLGQIITNLLNNAIRFTPKVARSPCA